MTTLTLTDRKDGALTDTYATLKVSGVVSDAAMAVATGSNALPCHFLSDGVSMHSDECLCPECRDTGASGYDDEQESSLSEEEWDALLSFAEEQCKSDR